MKLYEYLIEKLKADGYWGLSNKEIGCKCPIEDGENSLRRCFYSKCEPTFKYNDSTFGQEKQTEHSITTYHFRTGAQFLCPNCGMPSCKANKYPFCEDWLKHIEIIDESRRK